MSVLRFKGRKLIGKETEGLAVVSKQPVSFLGGVDPKKGLIVEKGHELEGVNISGKIFVFPGGKGSSVGSYVLYSMSRYGTAPLAIINTETEAIVATGCVLADIPLVDRLEKNPVEVIETGDYVKIFENGVVEVRKKLDS